MNALPPSHNAANADHSDSIIAFVKDNLEAIAVAVIMALVIKHFCVEAFKIPTSSMKPTLMGEGDSPTDPNSPGDRILVDKFAYLFSSPERWHVIVFRYPLDRGRNFIKRIAGLPGERLRISRDGDLWVRKSSEPDDALHIAQKPRDVREQFYRAVYPPSLDAAGADGDEGEDPRRNVERYWRVDEGRPNAWRLESHALFAFAGGARGVLRNASGIRDSSHRDSWALSGNTGPLVRDARFRFTLRLDEQAAAAPAADAPTQVSVSWRADGQFLAVLALSAEPGASRAFIRRGEEIVGEEALDVTLAPGGAYACEMEYVDGRLHVQVAGKEVASIADGRRFADTRDTGGDQALSIAAEGGALRIEDMRIDRDLRYINEWSGNPEGERQGVDVPADSYFMLGDNTRNSSDSRRWRITTVHLLGGRTIRYEGHKMSYLSPDTEGVSRKKATDVDGIVRVWREDAEDGEMGSPTEAAPFVHRSLIVGRAFLVFWPCWPEFPGRLGLIH